MRRTCDSCGKPYEAKRSSSRYCSQTCGKRARRRGKSATVTSLPTKPDDAPASGLVQAIRSELDAAGRLDTVPGQQALKLATRMDSEFDTGSAIASLSRELRAVMDEALKGVAAADGVDELKARRDRKRNAG